MEGYMYKQRYHASSKPTKSRKRYVVLDTTNEELRFYSEKNNTECHKTVPLDQILDVLDYDDTGFLVTMRFVATAEAANACFLFHTVATEDGSGAEELKHKWVKLLKNTINCPEHGLHLVKAHQESIHLRYEVTGNTKRTVLGTGMSGDVRLVRRKLDGKFFALKVVSLSGCSNAKLGALRRELDIHKSLDHPHISRFQEFFIEPKLCCRLVMELLEGGELFEKLQKHKRFSKTYAGKLTCIMIHTLHYLKKNNIVHRDLKLENWMFRDKEKNGADPEADTDIVLIDFGLSRRYRSFNEVMTRQQGTSYYIAPEVLDGHYNGNSCDMWSTGVINYMMLTGKPPFPGKNDAEIKTNVIKSSPNFGLPAFLEAPNALDFAKGLLERDLKKRFSTEEALNHIWVKVHEFHLDPKIVSRHRATITSRLKVYASYPELKRLVIEVIAFSLDHKEGNFRHLTEVFQWIDQDHDGYVTFEDIMNYFTEKDKHLEKQENITLPKITEEEVTEIKKVFQALDEENNQNVHINEFIAGCLPPKYFQNKVYLQEAFNRIDQTDKGKIDKNDLRVLLGKTANDDRVSKIWSIVFGNVEEISFRQFANFMKTDSFTFTNENFDSEYSSDRSSLKNGASFESSASKTDAGSTASVGNMKKSKTLTSLHRIRLFSKSSRNKSSEDFEKTKAKSISSRNFGFMRGRRGSHVKRKFFLF